MIIIRLNCLSGIKVSNIISKSSCININGLIKDHDKNGWLIMDIINSV